MICHDMTAKAVGEIMGTVPVKTELYFDNFYRQSEVAFLLNIFQKIKLIFDDSSHTECFIMNFI